MKTIVIDRSTDLKALVGKLAGNDTVKAQRLTESLIRTNPRANLERLSAGTVLIFDDDADGDTLLSENKATRAASDAPYALLTSRLKVAADAAIGDALSALDVQARQRKAVADTLKSAAMKRVISANAELQKLADATLAAHKKEQARAKEVDKGLREMQKTLETALQRLGDGL